LNFLESIFNDTGMGYVFANQDDSDYKLLLKQILQDQYIQKWHHDMQLSSRGKCYSTGIRFSLILTSSGDLQINK
jgi:hypothetical protein